MCQKECGAFQSMAGGKLSAALQEESLADGSCRPQGAQRTHSPSPQTELTERGPISRGEPARASIVCPSEHDQSPVLSVTGVKRTRVTS